MNVKINSMKPIGRVYNCIEENCNFIDVFWRNCMDVYGHNAIFWCCNNENQS